MIWNQSSSFSLNMQLWGKTGKSIYHWGPATTANLTKFLRQSKCNFNIKPWFYHWPWFWLWYWPWPWHLLWLWLVSSKLKSPNHFSVSYFFEMIVKNEHIPFQSISKSPRLSFTIHYYTSTNFSIESVLSALWKSLFNRKTGFYTLFFL